MSASTATIEVEQSVVDAVAESRRRRDEGMAQAESAQRASWDRQLIDAAIDALADTGRPFSANDLRDLLPDVRTALMGSRFYAAQNRGRIRWRGFVKSTKPNTHTKRIGLYQGIAQAVVEP